jgi:probable rRNA maturation factor
MKLTIYNRQKKISVSRETIKLIEKAIKLCVKRKEFPVPCEATVTLTDNDGIQSINKEHRGIDKPTDVLSFPLIEYSDGEPCIDPGDIDPETGRVFLGDIVISVDKAQEQAQNYGHSQDREFAFLAVHGTLHLLGFDHEIKEDEKIMFSIQEDILEEMGLPRT